MEIVLLPHDNFAANSYLLWGAGEAAVVDCGIDSQAVLSACEQLGVPLKYVLLTHVHYDHAAGAGPLQLAGAKICMHEDDIPLLDNGGDLGGLAGYPPCPKPDIVLKDGDKLRVCGQTLTVLHTPGHTPGSVCYLSDDTVFSGDTLFYLSVGRTDFPGGSARSLAESIKRLYAAAAGKRVLPGHDRATTVDFEKENNPYA